jgi:hypothetical protein
MDMKIITAILLAPLILSASLARAETFRDAQGHITGTSSTNSAGTTTFRDPQGRQTGTARTDSMGTTTFRDPQGRMLGTSSNRERTSGPR